MAHGVGINLLRPLRPDAGGVCDSTQPAETAADAAAESELPAEHGEESVDLGWDPPDTYDDYTSDPRGDYADSVGMPLHERMR